LERVLTEDASGSKGLNREPIRDRNPNRSQPGREDDGGPEMSSRRNERSRKAIAVMVLVFCCVLWGWSFPTMQYASRAFDSHAIGHEQPSALETLGTRALLNGLRFLLAGVLYGLFTWKHQRNFSRLEWVGGIAVGLCFGGGMLLQVLGLAWARPSVSGFLTSLAVVFGPLAQAGILRRRVGGTVWAAAGLALAGVVLLAWPNPGAAQGGLTASPPLPLLGEVLTVLGSIIFTAQILAIDHYGAVVSPKRLTSLMLLTCAGFNLAVAAGLSGGRLLQPSLLGSIATDATVWWSLGSLVLFSSVLAIPLMNTFQPRLSPATASVVYCSEPLFAALFSVLLGAEQLMPLTVAGGGAVLCAVLVVAVRSSK
jgi:drug/metabolite transporter (DMT)-like permease